ncbi:uncharacterized protein LOC134573429 [Pelobates fuscus]|uniref:uncharacterized protein LOC134573429 n=1 Tax=Pelobates fuscus TaxID=191477 RepID=UPI002FE491E5
MARPLHDGSSSQPVGNIQVETNRVFPSNVGSSCAIREHNRPLSQHSTPNPRSSSVPCQRTTTTPVNRCPTTHETGNNCEPGSSSSNCAQRLCQFPEAIARTAIPNSSATLVAHSGDISMVSMRSLRADIPMNALPLVEEAHIEREIAIRLRRIGDQMNELYLQRRLAGERHWWRPLRWHLTQFISEILAALYNPLLDILPHN